MKPLVEKLPLGEDCSFLVKTFRTPWVEVPWHQHIEYELILFLEGHGTCFIGNYVGPYGIGDIFFLGSNLPHTFKKEIETMISRAIVIQFREDFWGRDFLALPESKGIRGLFQTSKRGIRIEGFSKTTLTSLIMELESLSPFDRIIYLCHCLQLMSESEHYNELSTLEIQEFNFKKKERIDKVFHYTLANFQNQITLSEVSLHIGMSIPAFCTLFRKSTKKTYVDFLNEIRIGHACKLLMETQKSVETICYDCGYNTLSHFNKQFRKIKKTAPASYRRIFAIL